MSLAVFQDMLLALHSYIKHLSRICDPATHYLLLGALARIQMGQENPLHSLLKFYKVFLLG